MLELDFSQTLGNHCLEVHETLPASGITAISASQAQANLID